jgi:uncharacterized membrane protein
MKTKHVVLIGIIAALYCILTVAIAPISYGIVQFRISEVLKIFVLFDPYLAIGIGIGTFFANLVSPFAGPWELIFMPLTDIAGGLAAWVIFRTLGCRWPGIPMAVYAVMTGAAVGCMLFFIGAGGFWLLFASVAASELVILIGGLPILLPVIHALQKRGLIS